MNARFFHNITPRGYTTTGYRALQEQSRIQRASRTAGMLVSVGPRGTFIRSIKTATSNDGGTVIPRWG